MNKKTYQLVSVNVKDSYRVLLTNGKDPLTHDQACTMKSKFTEQKHRVIVLEEFKPLVI